MEQTKFEVEERNLFVQLASEIDHHYVGWISKELSQQLQLHMIKNVVFDFSKVTFMDSAGIGMVMGAYKATASLGGTTLVSNVNARVERILRTAGVYRFVRNIEI